MHTKTVNEVEQELLFKDLRVTFWEKHHSIPTMYDIMWGEMEA